MKRSPLRQRSAKLARLQRLYTKLRREFLTENPWCLRCGGTSTEVHHRAGRGPNLLRVETWASMCSDCHQYATTHPAEAIERGWSVRRIGTAS